jgi:glycosyltransferase involved in cell wall biosynthesis
MMQNIYLTEHRQAEDEPMLLPCSVIIPSYNSAQTIVECLRSVCSQETTVDYEVIVADSSDDETPALIAAHFPQVSLIRFEQRTDAGSARNAAIRQARGEILLFTDADCIVPPDWVERMISARQIHAYSVLGGSVLNGNPESAISSALYVKEFSEYLPNMRGGVVHTLPTCNLSYHREVFEQFGGYDGRYFPQEDYLFHWLLGKAGVQIYFDPEISVRHVHRQQMRAYLRHCYRFGVVTSQVLKVTDYPGHFFVQRPYLAPFFIPFLPYNKFILTCWRVFRVSPGLLFRHLLELPLVMVGLLVWQVGFTVGVYSTAPTETVEMIAIF